ncbi:ABC transporter permease subunit [Paenibacillus gansuensis]|uniref:ABC transporter permease subunit n=1 Tax=Paenibacillus gansuensis TaxID=306542 RepID=A0ABW5P6J8_9BACL
MKSVVSRLTPLLVSVAGAVLFALFPVLVQADAGGLAFQWKAAAETVTRYVSGLPGGESFQYELSGAQRSFFEDIGSYWQPSFTYVLTAAVGSILLGLAGAVVLYRSKRLRNLLDAVVVIPDFVIMIALQLFVVFFYKSTGVLLARVATFMSDEPAVALPLASMVIVPTFYVLRNLSVHIEEALTADYIRTIKAKGFSRPYILVKHMLPNVLPFLKADLPKFLGIIMSNLFIVEYFYNVHGITKLMMRSGREFSLVLNCLFTFMALYGLILVLVKGLIALLEKGVRR